MIIAIVILSFLTVVCFIIGLYFIFTAKRREITLRMKKFTRTLGQVIIEEKIEEKEKFKFKNILRILGKAFEARSYTRKIEKELLKADLPMRGEEFIVFNLIIFLLLMFIGFLIGGLGPTIVFGSLGLLIPSIILKRRKRLRFEKLNLQIGDCLTVMSNSLRAGFSFQQALELVSKEMDGPLAMEFSKTLREINFGTTTEQALLNMASRVESDNLDLMITAVLIQRQIGGNLAEILDNISNTLRERIRIKGEIKTLTAQGRISGMIIGFLPPVLIAVLLLLNPSYIGILIQKKIGILILSAGAVSEIIGVIFIRKIVNIEV
jgi:tight adherence protein B